VSACRIFDLSSYRCRLLTSSFNVDRVHQQEYPDEELIDEVANEDRWDAGIPVRSHHLLLYSPVPDPSSQSLLDIGLPGRGKFSEDKRKRIAHTGRITERSPFDVLSFQLCQLESTVDGRLLGIRDEQPDVDRVWTSLMNVSTDRIGTTNGAV
jgi:hypothetical protein